MQFNPCNALTMAVRRLSYFGLTVLVFYFSITTLLPGLVANFENLGNKNVVEQVYSERRETPWSTLFKDAPWEFTKADAYLKGGNKQHFLQNIMRSEKPSSYYLPGLISLMQGEFDTAIADFQTELLLSPGRDRSTSFLLGTVYALTGNQGEAIQTWRQYPEIASYFLRIGSDSLYNNHNSELAISYFKMANEVDSSNCEVSYRMGIALLAQGDKTQALETTDKFWFPCLRYAPFSGYE